MSKFTILKFIVDRIFELFAVFNKLTVNMNAFKLVFVAKSCFKGVVRSLKNGKP